MHHEVCPKSNFGCFLFTQKSRDNYPVSASVLFYDVFLLFCFPILIFFIRVCFFNYWVLKLEYPNRLSSTSFAHSRPSRIALTTSD